MAESAVLKVAEALVPTWRITTMHSTIISASITAYSTAVGPSSFAMKVFTAFQNRCMLKVLALKNATWRVIWACTACEQVSDNKTVCHAHEPVKYRYYFFCTSMVFIVLAEKLLVTTSKTRDIGICCICAIRIQSSYSGVMRGSLPDRQDSFPVTSPHGVLIVTTSRCNLCRW